MAKTKCLQSWIQIWGADQNTLLALYRTLTHSKLDYGAIVYGNASNVLELILRLQVLAHEPPQEVNFVENNTLSSVL